MKNLFFLSLLGLCATVYIFVSAQGGPATNMELEPDETDFPENVQTATFGAGCFWCVEEFFHQTPGVVSTLSGYMGGSKETATYNQVKTGRTDHVEVVQVYFDPAQISFDQLLNRFFELHDPTTLNRQGADRGTMYRSVIFYRGDDQKSASEKKIKELTDAEAFEDPIVTAVEEAMEFYLAEDYHQNYARLNPDNPYLKNVLYPKLKKVGLEIPKSGGE
ncbi:MAG: peptide-methionine (S)-S-oxide reductase MsrA [Verrucomicrobiota bacterium]